jgi:archaeosine-15-forming tRNA-guanine transglycosylase
MPNTSHKFIDPDGNYTGGYTSKTLHPTAASHRSVQTRCVIQVNVPSGTLSLQMRLTPDAPWFVVKTYSASTVEEMVLANDMRIVVTEDAEAWLGEIV